MICCTRGNLPERTPRESALATKKKLLVRLCRDGGSLTRTLRKDDALFLAKRRCDGAFLRFVDDDDDKERNDDDGLFFFFFVDDERDTNG